MSVKLRGEKGKQMPVAQQWIRARHFDKDDNENGTAETDVKYTKVNKRNGLD